MAAVMLRVPTLAFEPNAVPGLANRLVGRVVTAAAVNFNETKRYFRSARVTGIPVRREFFEVSAKTAGSRRRLLVFGGSQGARALNRALPKIAGELLDSVPGLDIVHQTGGRHGDSTRELYERAGLSDQLANGRVRVQPYLDAMVAEFAAADLMLCRSGASTMAELAAAGKPSLLVPFPQAADDHQRKNADVFVAAGAAKLIAEPDLTEDWLLLKLQELLGDETRLSTMAEIARGLGHPHAVRDIGRMVAELAALES